MRSYSLESEITGLIREEKFSLAVLLSQTLLELRTEVELTDYLRNCPAPELERPVMKLLPGSNLGSGRVRRFAEGLGEIDFNAEHGEEFRQLGRHQQRRNAIAHDGAVVTREEAQESFAAVLKVTQILHESLYKAQGREAELEEEQRMESEEEIE
jgi:hypothetical protein